MSQTISNSEIERVRNDTFRPQLPLKHGSRKLGEWNIFVFYASLIADDAHPERRCQKESVSYMKTLCIGLPEGFKRKGTSDPELKRIFCSRIGTEAGEFIAERTAIENLRRVLPPTNDHDRKEVEDLLVKKLMEVLIEFDDRLDIDADVLLYSKQRNAFDNQLQYFNTDAAGRALTSQGLGRQFHRHIEMKHDREYVAPTKNDKLTEQDYLANIWYPIFSHLFKSGDDSSKIRLKVGESIFKYTTDEKKTLFQRSRHDEAKLSRKGKGVIDHLAKLPTINLCPMSWLIQIANCQCRLSIIHLAGDGLYVTVPQFDQIALPKSFNDMDCIISSLKALVTMEHSLRKIADLLPSAYAKKEQLEDHLGRRSTLKPEYTDWLRGTFYTPPNTFEPRLPVDLFSRRPFDLKSKHLDTLLQEFAKTGNAPDKFGWISLPHLKKHYNIITKKYSAHHPFNHSQAPTPTPSTPTPISSSASSSASSSEQS
ncbi:hypothetical protein INT45_011782 [Circinella minor]|uniref:Uncharacterized protein n=1 Tax=Circinella minor TaxID=1195481 RepID=A0A8H7S925_9FUNG|nr:hypothetical protein INT45_011782 [Circinella minor]